LDSSNSLRNGADIVIEDSISLTEDFTPTNTDDDPFTDGAFAEGSGRTGILISGASPFEGNIELAAGSEITVEGNDSFGINLANTPMMTDGLTGNLLTAGQITMVGDRSAGVNIASNVTGNVTNEGNITIRGTGSEAYAVSGDINGGFVSNGVISNSGYRDINQRRPFAGDLSNAGREDLTAEDLRQAGSAINISGNISNGIFLNERLVQGVNGDVDGDGDSTVMGISLP